MKKILFSHSYFLRFDPKQWNTAEPYAPLATLYAAALLRENGYEVALFDSMFARDPSDLVPFLHQQDTGIFVIYDDGFNYLTKMCLTNMREAAFAMISLARDKGCTVIVSSSDATDHYGEYLEQGADFVILGEAEQTLLELTAALHHPLPDLSSIKGLAYRTAGNIHKTAARAVMRDLDLLPWPAWDLVDMAPYRRSWMKKTGSFSMNVVTTRGCPFKCNWCAKPIYGNRYNSRSPANVVKELKLLKDTYEFDHIWFCDDIFGLKPGWVNEFADLVNNEGLKFRFRIQARADLLSQENYVHALARAGCDNIWMGAESGSQKILDAMDKGIRVEQIYTATRLVKKYGMRPSFFIQFGYPGETKEDIRQTIHMITELLPFSLGISISYPLPGTPFYDRVKAELGRKSNWTDSDELSLMFKNTYPPAFYRQLHTYVHKTYRKHLALENLRNLISQPATIRFNNLKKAASIAWYMPATFMARRKLKTLEVAPSR